MRYLALITLAVAVIASSVASAGTVEISGSGTWGPGTATTDLSAPNTSWSFSFDVVDPLTPLHDILGNAIPTITNAQYLLGGVPVSGNPIVGTGPGVGHFYSAQDYGLFSLNFSNLEFLSFYGDQIFDSTTYALLPGTYQALADYKFNSGVPGGTGTGQIVVGVPEPTSWIGLGFGITTAAGLAARRRFRSFV